MTAMPTDSNIHLEGIPNTRQLGGISTADGRRVRSNMLYRSARLCTATPNDIDRLEHQLHIGYIIDLRTAYEVTRQPDIDIPGSQYINMPISPESNNMWVIMAHMPGKSDEEKLFNFARTEQAQRMTKKIYTSFVTDEYCQLQFAAFLNTLVQAPEVPILWHCTQGKDRTGLTAALLLFALGCDRETVVREFARSNDSYLDLLNESLARFRQQGSKPEEDDVVVTLLGVMTSYFEDALDTIDNLYGGIDRYLHETLVLSDKEISILREKYLEQAS